MKLSMKLAVVTTVFAGVAFLGACDTADGRGKTMATSLGDVRLVKLEANQCRDGITSGLGERGFSVTTEPGVAEAVLEVEISGAGRNLDEVPNFGGVGNKATYAATLLGARDKVLFSTSGSEGSVNMAELCGDIGDEIGERLQQQKG